LNVEQHGKFEEEKIHGKNHSLWRYSHAFPYIDEADIISLGEGWTPLVKFSNNVSFKLENLNPTGSFKDRGSSILVSTLHKQIREADGYMSEDSSGNAGASIAAYSARAGLKAKVYVPETVSGPKLNQIQFYGAEVVKVAGGRSKVANEAQKVGKGKFYVGHILHPLFRDGMRSLAYEIVEQLDWRAPESIYLPVSAGTLLLGLISGFNHLRESSILRTMPRIVACQTNQVSPLYHHFKNLAYTPPRHLTSIADALVSVNPPLLEVMVERLKAVNGDAVIVDEDEILFAFKELSKHGFFVEPSSAVAYAGYKKQIDNKDVSKDDYAVVVLTGTGLKTALKPD
jgi:threonine synthase